MVVKAELIDYVKILKRKQVLDHVNFQFETGKTYGLLGRNGSGKTMILRALAGLIFATSGSVKVDGLELHKDIDFPADTGVIIETTNLLPQYTAFENLNILAQIRKVASTDDIIEALHAVGLDGFESSRVSTFSLGMRQKLSIAQAIFEHPKFLLLDEPTNALDEQTVVKIRKILKKLNNQGCTIVIASHNKDDLNILADEILHVHDGRIN